MNELYKYEIVTIDSLKEYENNSRTHDQEQILQLEKSINEFGFTNPLLVDQNGFIRAGHARFIAAKNLGFNELPIILIDKLNENQLAALVIADNKLAENSGWNTDILKSEFLALDEAGFDLSLMGFDDDFISDLFDDEQEDIDPEITTDISESVGEVFELIITCNSEHNLEKSYLKAKEMGWVCRTSIL